MKINSYIILCLALLSAVMNAYSQDSVARTSAYAGLTLGFGSSQTTASLSYEHNWKLGKKKRLELGVGGRFSSFFASDKYFITAPAKLAKGTTGPGAFFKEPIPANIDSVFLPTAQINSFNVMLTIGYNFSDRFRAGFNIDVIGFSFGGTKGGTYINAPTTSQQVTASPAGFNLLLVGENDLGSLNSELYVAYAINDKWSVKLGVQHVFMEYVTDTKIQQFPEPNDRFRITPTVVCFGVALKIH